MKRYKLFSMLIAASLISSTPVYAESHDNNSGIQESNLTSSETVEVDFSNQFSDVNILNQIRSDLRISDNKISQSDLDRVYSLNIDGSENLDGVQLLRNLQSISIDENLDENNTIDYLN